MNTSSAKFIRVEGIFVGRRAEHHIVVISALVELSGLLPWRREEGFRWRPCLANGEGKRRQKPLHGDNRRGAEEKLVGALLDVKRSSFVLSLACESVPVPRVSLP